MKTMTFKLSDNFYVVFPYIICYISSISGIRYGACALNMILTSYGGYVLFSYIHDDW